MALFGKQLTLNSRDVPAAPPVVQCPVAFFEADESATEIGGANGGTPAVGGGAPPTAPASRGTFDFDNILKLIPGEVIAPFITGSGLPLTDIGGFSWRLVVFCCCLLACVLLRGQASKPVGAGWGVRGVNWPLVGVSAFAFFLWAHAVNENGPVFHRSLFGGLPANMSPTAIWGFFAVIFGLIAPILVPQAPARTDG